MKWNGGGILVKQIIAYYKIQHYDLQNLYFNEAKCYVTLYPIIVCTSILMGILFGETKPRFIN